MNPKLQTGSKAKGFMLFAIVLVVLILSAAIRWMVMHPFPIHSDEAWYAAQAQVDLHTYQRVGLHHALHGITHGDPSRPPAYRLIALPFLILFGYHIVLLRMINFALFLFAAWFIYLTVQRISGRVGGAIAGLVFVLSPTALQACICYGTEGPLYLGIAATFYFVSAYWADASEPRSNWIGLGLALGVGCLSKATFAFIAGPAVLLSAYLILQRRKGFGGLYSLAKACVLAFLVAIPWWRVNLGGALSYGKYASREFVRHSMGSHSSLTPWMLWIEGFFLSLLGPGISILIVWLLVSCFRNGLFRRESPLTPLQQATLLVCICSVIPLVVVQLVGTNFLLRLISGIVIPISIAAGVLTNAGDWARSKTSMKIIGGLIFAQLVMLVFPVISPNAYALGPGTLNGYPWRVMIRFEQWDWKPLQAVSRSCGFDPQDNSTGIIARAYSGETPYAWGSAIGRPRISFLGNGRAFNGSQIHFPWLKQGAAWPDINWLWKYEDGPIDWTKTMSAVDRSDLVITAPHYVGEITDKQDLDNQYNEEFTDRMSKDPRFSEPIRFQVGQMEPVEIVVFPKKSLNCH